MCAGGSSKALRHANSSRVLRHGTISRALCHYTRMWLLCAGNCCRVLRLGCTQKAAVLWQPKMGVVYEQ